MANPYRLSALQQYLQYKSLENYIQRPALMPLPVRTPTFYPAFNQHQQYITNTMPFLNVMQSQVQTAQPYQPRINQYLPPTSFSKETKQETKLADELVEKLAELSKTASPESRPETVLSSQRQVIEEKRLKLTLTNNKEHALEQLSTETADSRSNKEDELHIKHKKKRLPTKQDVATFECFIPGCGKNYGTKSALNSHIKQKHTVRIDCIADTNGPESCTYLCKRLPLEYSALNQLLGNRID